MASDRVTMEDVAARAGVSRALVSIVFRGVTGASDATRERVLAAARELDYRPDTRASRLGRTRTRMVGVTFSVGAAFHGDLIQSLYTHADAAGYEVVLSGVTPDRSESAAVETLLAERCESIVVLGSALGAAELGRLAGRLPVVSVLRAVRGEVDVVRTDDADRSAARRRPPRRPGTHPYRPARRRLRSRRLRASPGLSHWAQACRWARRPRAARRPHRARRSLGRGGIPRAGPRSPHGGGRLQRPVRPRLHRRRAAGGPESAATTCRSSASTTSARRHTPT